MKQQTNESQPSDKTAPNNTSLPEQQPHFFRPTKLKLMLTVMFILLAVLGGILSVRLPYDSGLLLFLAQAPVVPFYISLTLFTFLFSQSYGDYYGELFIGSSRIGIILAIIVPILFYYFLSCAIVFILNWKKQTRRSKLILGVGSIISIVLVVITFLGLFVGLFFPQCQDGCSPLPMQDSCMIVEDGSVECPNDEVTNQNEENGEITEEVPDDTPEEVSISDGFEGWKSHRYLSNGVPIWVLDHPDDWETDGAGLHEGSLAITGEWNGIDYLNNFYYPIFYETGIPSDIDTWISNDLGRFVSDSNQIEVEDREAIEIRTIIAPNEITTSGNIYYIYIWSHDGKNPSVVSVWQELPSDDIEELSSVGRRILEGLVL